jgi:hypothetical protein
VHWLADCCMVLVLEQGFFWLRLWEEAECFVQVNQRPEELEALALTVGLDTGEVELVEWPLLKWLVGFDCILILFFHEEEGGLEEHFPLIDDTFFNLNIFCPVDNVVGLIKIFILNLDLEHHFNA